jgi:hypothetical protein
MPNLFLSIYYILRSINSELKLVNYYKKLNYNEHYKYSQKSKNFKKNNGRQFAYPIQK